MDGASSAHRSIVNVEVSGFFLIVFGLIFGVGFFLMYSKPRVYSRLSNMSRKKLNVASNKNKKIRKHCTNEQKQLLLRLILQRPKLLRGERNHAFTNADLKKEWNDIEEILNKIGPYKPAIKWREIWASYKRNLRLSGFIKSRQPKSQCEKQIIAFLIAQATGACTDVKSITSTEELEAQVCTSDRKTLCTEVSPNKKSSKSIKASRASKPQSPSKKPTDHSPTDSEEIGEQANPERNEAVQNSVPQVKKMTVPPDISGKESADTYNENFWRSLASTLSPPKSPNTLKVYPQQRTPPTRGNMASLYETVQAAQQLAEGQKASTVALQSIAQSLDRIASVSEQRLQQESHRNDVLSRIISAFESFVEKFGSE